MAPPTRTPRIAWIRQALRALAAGGPDAIRVEPLARTLGVTRGGFYWHFEDRRALLDAVLDSWEQSTTEEVAERLRRIDNRRMGYLRSLFSAFSPDTDEVEARSFLAFSLLIGNHYIAADHGSRRRADVLELALKQLGGVIPPVAN